MWEKLYTDFKRIEDNFIGIFKKLYRNIRIIFKKRNSNDNFSTLLIKDFT